VALSSLVDGVAFTRLGERNFATTEVTATHEQAIDVALAKVTRALNKLALVYDEGLWTTRREARAELLVTGAQHEKFLDSFAEFQVDVLKDERHRDLTVWEGLQRPMPENEAILSQMMSYYNKGLRAVDSDPFNAFLSFWGCLETYLRNELNRNPRRSDFIRHLERIKVGKNEAVELYGEYRSAIAHASYDPSALDDVGAVAARVPRIKELAREFTKKMLVRGKDDQS
jgi:hypothetical protein